MRTPRVICELKAWQWQVEGYVIAGIVHNPRTSFLKEGAVQEFNFYAVAQYPPTLHGEGSYFLGKLPTGDYVKCYIADKGTGDPLKSLFGSSGPDKSGSR